MKQGKDGKIQATHGIRSLALRGDGLLSEVELMSLRELKMHLRDPQVRRGVREELTARLIVICRRGFDYLEEHSEHYGMGDGPIKYLGMYASLLVRTLDKWPSASDEAVNVQELKRIDEVLDAAAEGTDE